MGWWQQTPPPAEADNRSLILFDRGDEVSLEAGEDGIRFTQQLCELAASLSPLASIA